MKKKLLKRLVVVCNLSSQPRIHKRVDAINKVIISKVFGFRRRIYEENEFSDSVDYNSLGYIEDGSYLKRVFNLFRAWLTLLKEAKNGDGLYAFGFDCFLIGKLAGIKYSIVELGDIRSANNPNSCLARLERLTLRGANKIVITSPYFYDLYFKKYGFEKDKFILLENRLPSNMNRAKSKVASLQSGEKIRIGLIGLFRYRREIETIISFVESNHERYTLECFGAGPCLDLIINSDCESINYHGEFKSPDDLGKIYGQVDVNYICYDSSDENVKIALPNKYYESVFFNTPVICSEGTALQVEVEKHKVGFAIKIPEKITQAETLDNIDKRFVEKYSINCHQIDGKKLLDDSESILKKVISNVYR